jgi:hypothetical protein
MKELLLGSTQSKTIWFNSLMLALMPLTADLTEALPQLQEYLPDNLYKLLFAATTVGNIIIRFYTRLPLSLK